MQEGIHWSLKSRLANKKVELHNVVPFFRDFMQTRRLTRERLQSAPDSLARLHLRAAKSGCSRYSEKIKIYLTIEGQQSALRRLQDALDYQVWPIMEEGEIRSMLKIAERSSNSSARRFLLLVDAVYPVPGILEKFPPVLESRRSDSLW
jgi:hypothetical protein